MLLLHRECNDLSEDFKVKNSKFVDTIGSSKVVCQFFGGSKFGITSLCSHFWHDCMFLCLLATTNIYVHHYRIMRDLLCDNTSLLQMEEMNDFDDFGVDLCPVPEVSSFDCELDLDKRYCSGGDKTNDSVPRWNIKLIASLFFSFLI